MSGKITWSERKEIWEIKRAPGDGGSCAVRGRITKLKEIGTWLKLDNSGVGQQTTEQNLIKFGGHLPYDKSLPQ